MLKCVDISDCENKTISMVEHSNDVLFIKYVDGTFSFLEAVPVDDSYWIESHKAVHYPLNHSYILVRLNILSQSEVDELHRKDEYAHNEIQEEYDLIEFKRLLKKHPEFVSIKPADFDGEKGLEE